MSKSSIKTKTVLPKIQTEAEFSEVMSEHFVGFPPSGGTRNYAHGGKGPFRTSD